MLNNLLLIGKVSPPSSPNAQEETETRLKRVVGIEPGGNLVYNYIIRANKF